MEHAFEETGTDIVAKGIYMNSMPEAPGEELLDAHVSHGDQVFFRNCQFMNNPFMTLTCFF